MATHSKIIDVLEVLSGSGMEYTPADMSAIADAWITVFDDIPDELLHQAMIDYLRTETRWPAPAKLRALAARIKSNNGQSVSGGAFSDPSRPPKTGEVPGMCVVTTHGWESYKLGQAKPVGYPHDVQVEIDQLCALDRLPTDEEFAHLDALRHAHAGDVQ